MVAMRELEYRLELRANHEPTALPLVLCAAADVIVTTTVAHLDDESLVWRILNVQGEAQEVAKALESFEAYEAPWLVDKNVLGHGRRKLILWVKYQVSGTPSQTALVFRHLGRDTVVTDHTRGRSLTIRVLTPDRGAVAKFLRSAEEAATPRYQFRLLYTGPVREREAEALTTAEENAIRAAYQLGYYDVPRQAEVRLVAQALDIAPSTASYRLRRAEQKLVRAQVG